MAWNANSAHAVMRYAHDVRPELPSLTALQAFEAALRHRSFSRAAEELYRTQGAVSRQVQQLERELGVELFRREHPRIVPTAAAERFGTRLRALLDRLEALTLEVRSATATGGVLELAILPTFGTRWLIPRLASFRERHPDVALQLSTRLTLFDFEVELLDAAIHYGDATWPGAELEPLFQEEVTVVAAPAVARTTALTDPADLATQPLLQLQSRPAAWDEWFTSAGVAPRALRSAARFEHHLMIIQAAIAGLGFALLPTFLVRPELERGELVEPFPALRFVGPKAYYLAFPPRNRDLPALRAFASWLRVVLSSDGLG
jgi:LysR family glycine cleavage system transcriptional activator